MTATATLTRPAPQDRRDLQDEQASTPCPGAPRPALRLQRRLVARMVG